MGDAPPANGRRDAALAVGALAVMLVLIVLVAQISADRDPPAPAPGSPPAFKVSIELSRTA
ncbi:hypothetical protein GCM10009827_063360 [Dactylosporangium maewongense]|uniref:Uncharacterized protein n=1 Tax=Dactylosporangium maewongense TaxID=634393 RepID=A0ABN2B8S7_9ACTN